MKTRLFFLAILAVTVVACISSAPGRELRTYHSDEETVTVAEIPFVRVEASAYAFNETATGRPVDGAAYVFESVQSAFFISQQPITVDIYEKIINDGGSFGRLEWPRNGLCAEDVDKFLDKLYHQSGVPVIIPTEAMIEAAIKSDALALDKSDEVITSDGWVATREARAIECDWWVPAKSSMLVARSEYERKPIESFRRRVANKFYLAIRLDEPIPSELLQSTNHTVALMPELSDGDKEVFQVSGAIFTMIPVGGGTLEIGATPEQEKYADEDEGPVTSVTLDDFKIGETEVTIGQWLAIMGVLPVGNDKNQPDRAVGNVSFFRAQEFIRRLSDQSGRQFRLPTEEEWEYAARGGQKTRGYIFSGSNNAKDVAVCSFKNKRQKDTVRPKVGNVKSKRPNELGLYDMSGSQWEWTIGSMDNGDAVQRGGSWKSLNIACRVSNRQGMNPREKKDTFGFRLAL